MFSVTVQPSLVFQSLPTSDVSSATAVAVTFRPSWEVVTVTFKIKKSS